MSHDDSRGLRGRTSGVNRRKALKALAAAGGASLAGCAGGGGDGGGAGGDGGDTSGTANKKSPIDGDSVHFVKGETGDPMRKVLERAGRTFEEETGATLDWEFTGIGDSKFERLVALIQSGDPPEVGTVNLTIGIQFKQRGALAPLTEQMNNLVDEFGEPVVRYQADGEDWMIPFTQGVTEHWFRNDIQGDIGVSDDLVPDTWENQMEYAQAAYENRDAIGTQAGTFVMSGKAKATGNYMMGSYHMSNNGQITEYNNGEFEVAFASGEGRDKMIETLSFIQDLHDYSVDAGGAGESENEHALPTGLGNDTFDAGARVKLHSAHHQNTPYDDASYVQNIGHHPAKETNDTQAQVGPMYVFSGADNVQAGKMFLEHLMGTVELASDFCWADGPVHCQPPFPGIKQSDYYRGLLREDLADHWWMPNEEPHNSVPTMATRHLETATSNAMSQVFETDPPNPWLGAIWASALLSEMVRACNIRSEDPEAVVDEYAPQCQEVMDRASGN